MTNLSKHIVVSVHLISSGPFIAQCQPSFLMTYPLKSLVDENSSAIRPIRSIKCRVNDTDRHLTTLSMSIHSFSANNAFQVLMFLPGFDCLLRRQAYVVELIASETFSRVISPGGRTSLPNLQRRGEEDRYTAGGATRRGLGGNCRLSSSSNSSSHPQEHPPASVRPPY